MHAQIMCPNTLARNFQGHFMPLRAGSSSAHRKSLMGSESCGPDGQLPSSCQNAANHVSGEALAWRHIVQDEIANLQSTLGEVQLLGVAEQLPNPDVQICVATNSKAPQASHTFRLLVRRL